MTTLQDVLEQKGSKVLSIAPSATVLDATEKMNRQKVGCLLVMEDEQVVGIFTERDVLKRVVGEQRRPSEMFVAEVMTTDVVCCTPDADVNEVASLMKNRRIRHVPVCDSDGKVIGLISIGDLNAAHASAQQAEIHYLHEYIYGRV